MACISLVCLAPVSGSAQGLQGVYAGRPEVGQFIRTMAEKHRFDETELHSAFARAERLPSVLKAILPPASPRTRSWKAYRSRYVEPIRISAGINFWQEHASVLRRAAQQYGVPEEIIVAIIGVETIYGRHTGSLETFSSLTTLAFDYPPRAALFLEELENLLLLSRDQQRPVTDYRGSYAGALGVPQFLPSSYRRYAVDFNGDGRIDIENQVEDAIGSVASFLVQHGWQAGKPVAMRATVSRPSDIEAIRATDIDPVWTPEQMSAAGIAIHGAPPAGSTAALIELTTPDQAPEYWAGFSNFYVITRYNRSSFYAMAVFELSRALHDTRERGQISESLSTPSRRNSRRN